MSKVRFFQSGRWAHPTDVRWPQLEVSEDQEFEVGEGEGQCHPAIAELAKSAGRAEVVESESERPEEPESERPEESESERPGRGRRGRRGKRESKDSPLE